MKHKFRNDVELESFFRRMDAKGLDTEGREMVDSTPMQPPVGFVKQPSMFEQVRAMVATELQRRNDEVESPEDAADMGDDEDDLIEALSEYENYDLQMELARRLDAEKGDRFLPPELAPGAPTSASQGSPGAPGVVPPSDGPSSSAAPQRSGRKPAKPAEPLDGDPEQ